jgi:hypothetical protein
MTGEPVPVPLSEERVREIVREEILVREQEAAKSFQDALQSAITKARNKRTVVDADEPSPKDGVE